MFACVSVFCQFLTALSVFSNIYMDVNKHKILSNITLKQKLKYGLWKFLMNLKIYNNNKTSKVESFPFFKTEQNMIYLPLSFLLAMEDHPKPELIQQHNNLFLLLHTISLLQV